MPMNGLDITEIVSALRGKLDPYLVLLFGSWAKERARADSDVDIAYWGDRRCSDYERFMLGQQIAGLIGKEVDLIDLSRASTVMQAQIVTSGHVIYCSDELRRMEYFMRVLKEYTLLNEERLPVLQAIERRGRIYGF